MASAHYRGSKAHHRDQPRLSTTRTCVRAGIRASTYVRRRYHLIQGSGSGLRGVALRRRLRLSFNIPGVLLTRPQTSVALPRDRCLTRTKEGPESLVERRRISVARFRAQSGRLFGLRFAFRCSRRSSENLHSQRSAENGARKI